MGLADPRPGDEPPGERDSMILSLGYTDDTAEMWR
jgi:hypothetical protein